MFNNHILSVVSDLGILGNNINNTDLLAVAAITSSEYPNLPNIYNGIILVPPSELLMAWADSNDNNILQYGYGQYLNTQEPDSFITALLALLTRKNVVLYIPRDDFNVFGNILLNHLYFVFGIICQTPNSKFYVDPTRIPIIMAKFFMIDVMSAEDFIDGYPSNVMLPDFTINKLANDLHPFAYQTTFEEYRKYFNNLNASKNNVKIDHPEMVKIIR